MKLTKWRSSGLLLPVLSLCLCASVVTSADENLAPRIDVVKKNVPEIKKAVEADYEHLDTLYKHIHANPELSLKELQTAARLAKELRDAGYTVTEKVGGTGVVGILQNGKGPVVMVRADMDALPVVEKTGVPYASKVKVRDEEGNEVGVMHSCGHDINMTCLVGLGRLFAKRKDTWQGTLMLVCQPAEEVGLGAKHMLADGLFEKFPKPDVCFGLHCDGRYPHGHINYRDGQMQANVDEVDIIVKGKGGHGAAPQACIDPVVIAARIVIDLQTIASRETDPSNPIVVTVGSIHGGTKHNIIPNDVKLQLTVRTLNDDTRKKVFDAITRIAKGAAATAGAPEPAVELRPHFTPALINDSPLARRTVPVLKEALGADKVNERGISMGGEDFSRYIRAGVPGFYFFLGTASPASVAEANKGGKPLPSLHSDSYYPIPEPTIKTGVLAMSAAVLNVLGK